VRQLGWVTRERSLGGREAPPVIDWLVAAGLIAVAMVEAVNRVFPGPEPVVAMVVMAATLPVAFRRVAPVPAIAFCLAVSMPYVVAYSGQFGGGSVANAGTQLLLIYSVGRHTRGRQLLVGAVFVLILLFEPAIGAHRDDVSTWAFDLVFGAAALSLGVAVRAQVGRSISLAVAADRAWREREAAARAAVQDERARIARELHDVVAHNVGLIVLQAGGARSVLGTDPARATTALLQIEETGRQTLTEMRHLVGILRVEDGPGPGPQQRSHPERPSEADGTAIVRRVPVVLDWLVAAALAILALVETANGVFPGPIPIVAVVQLAATLPVAFRRVAPLPAIAFTAAVLLPYVVFYGMGNSVANGGTLLLLVYSVGRHLEGRRLLAGAFFGLLLLGEELAGAGLLLSLSDWAYLLIVFGGALGLGVVLRVQVGRSVGLAVAAERASSGHGAVAQAAVQDERARIARELHDVVADKVGLIVLQAGGARSVLGTDLDRARNALLQIEETGRQTLAEMRHLVGILRIDDEVERRPLPSLERLPALVDETRAAGLAAELEVSGTVVGLPAGLELAAYRLIQEALTNVRKHAPTARTQVHLGYEPEGLRIEVRNDGGSSAAVPGKLPDSTGPGHGLIGMRERVQLYGGRMETGPVPGGGFRVAAVLPLSFEAA
jgi:signal transduction histidine kinase